MTQLRDYHQGTAQWRAVLAQNYKRSRYVMITFVAIYAMIGLLMDMLIYSYLGVYSYPYSVPHPIDLELLRKLITFELIPRATIITAAVALIAIMITYMMHNKIMLFGTNSKEITPNNTLSIEERKLYNVVDEMRIASSLAFMPRVYIIEADYMNAFASGVSPKSSMVAITRGLLNKLNRAELQAVMAHELSHIKHMDMKLTLIATVLSNIMLLITDILFRGMLYSDHRKVPPQIILFIVVLRIVLPLITVVLLLYLSRTREYMADAGAVQLTRDNGPMASALLKIHHDTEINQHEYIHDYQHTPNESMRRNAYLYDPKAAGVSVTQQVSSLFSSHPPLESRLNAIGFKRKPQRHHNRGDVAASASDYDQL